MFDLLKRQKRQMVLPEEALTGRDQALMPNDAHFVLGTSMTAPFEGNAMQAVFGLGCFWGAEKIFWQLPGVYSTAVGYSAGYTPNPSYEEVCTGKTGHNEVVLVVFDPALLSYQQLLSVFWESHDPTQLMQQGNDVGTQYRSGIYTFSDQQQALAKASRTYYNERIKATLGKTITTEIEPMKVFYYAEDYHQQYLAKNPMGYCGHVAIDKTNRPRFSQ